MIPHSCMGVRGLAGVSPEAPEPIPAAFIRFGKNVVNEDLMLQIKRGVW